MSGLLAGKVWLSALAPHLKPLAAMLADIGNDDGTKIYPTVAYMAWKLGRSRRSVQTGLHELLELGVLQIVQPGGGITESGYGIATRYRMQEDMLPKRAPWKERRENRATVAPFNEGLKAQSTTETAQSTTRTAQPASPNPSVEPLVETSTAAPQGGTPAAPAKQREPKRIHPVQDPKVRAAVKHWADLWGRQRGQAPFIAWPRACGQLATIVRARGLESTLALLERFFVSRDRVICQSDYSIGAFLGNVNKLIGEPPAQGKTAEMLRGLAAWGEEHERNERERAHAGVSAGDGEAPRSLSAGRPDRSGHAAPC